MTKKYTFPAVLGLLLTLFLIVPSGNFGKRAREEEPRYGGILRLKSFTNSFRAELDPAKPDSFIFVSEQLFDGLVRLDKNFNIVPSLAEYWEISPDGKTYTFYIRKGVKFHDGEELTAADVKFSLERILDKNTESPYYEIFLSKVVGAEDFREGRAEGVSGFRILNTRTLEIHWTRPFVSALYMLSMHFCKILPRELVLSRGERFFTKPVGTGPFKFDSFIRDTQLEAVGVRMFRNDAYFLEKPYLDGVEFCPHFTLDHFINSEIESFPVVSDRLLCSDYQIFQDGSLHLFFLGMSNTISPLDSEIVRRAISYTINKSEFVQQIKDIRFSRQVTNYFIPSKLPGFFPVDDEETYDLERARRLMRKAGYRDGDSFPVLTLFLSLPKTETKYRIFRELKRQLSNVGIQLRQKYLEGLDEYKKYEYPHLFLGGILMGMPDPEDIIRPLFFSESDSNIFGYTNPQLDSLLLEAEIEPSWTKRTNLFHRIEQILLSDTPAVPLFTQQNQVAMQPYVRGVEVHPLGFYYLEARKIWLDKQVKP